VDGIGAISLADGVVYFDMMSITSIQDGKAVAALAMSLPAMINELVQKGVLQKNEPQAKAAQLATAAPASKTA